MPDVCFCASLLCVFLLCSSRSAIAATAACLRQIADFLRNSRPWHVISKLIHDFKPISSPYLETRTDSLFFESTNVPSGWFQNGYVSYLKFLWSRKFCAKFVDLRKSKNFLQIHRILFDSVVVMHHCSFVQIRQITTDLDTIKLNTEFFIAEYFFYVHDPFV